MHQDTFVRLSLLAFGLIVASFVVRGVSQFVVSADTANLITAPTMLLGAVLVVALTIQSVLAVTGVRPLEE